MTYVGEVGELVLYRTSCSNIRYRLYVVYLTTPSEGRTIQRPMIAWLIIELEGIWKKLS
jgi:hypothetical protein